MGTVRILLSSPLWRTAALSTLHEFIKHATNPSTANFSPLCVYVFCVYMFFPVTSLFSHFAAQGKTGNILPNNLAVSK